MRNVFFGSTGLTSTSANHLANMAKEAYQAEVEELESVRLYSESISLLGTVGETPISYGNDDVFLQLIPQRLEDIAALKSLIAWLREAIKARKEAVVELQQMELDDYCQEIGIEMPTMPSRSDYAPMTEDDYYESLPIKERNAYYSLQTKAAVVGKYIHESGALSKARKALSTVKSQPVIVNNTGRDTTICKRVASVKQEEVDELFFKLQAKYREYQASLNAIKHKCELVVEQDEREKHDAYKKAYDAYVRQLKALELQMEKYKQEKATELQSLKIVIPDSLRAIYDKVASLGK